MWAASLGINESVSVSDDGGLYLLFVMRIHARFHSGLSATVRGIPMVHMRRRIVASNCVCWAAWAPAGTTTLPSLVCFDGTPLTMSRWIRLGCGPAFGSFSCSMTASRAGTGDASADTPATRAQSHDVRLSQFLCMSQDTTLHVWAPAYRTAVSTFGDPMAMISQFSFVLHHISIKSSSSFSLYYLYQIPHQQGHSIAATILVGSVCMNDPLRTLIHWDRWVFPWVLMACAIEFVSYSTMTPLPNWWTLTITSWPVFLFCFFVVVSAILIIFQVFFWVVLSIGAPDPKEVMANPPPVDGWLGPAVT